MNQTQKLRQFVLSEIAKACAVDKSAVSHWLRRDLVPPEHCLAIEQFTGGQVTRYDLRPDVFGRPAEDRHD